MNFAVRFFHYTLILMVFGGAWLLGSWLFIVHEYVFDFSPIAHYQPGRPSIVFDDLGNEWMRFQRDKREPIALQDLPEHLVQAFLAAEDRQFFQHAGISLRGIIRSLIVNIYHGSRRQGGSTITQQLVKLLFLDSEKTFSRKIREQFFALLIEQHCTKEQILQTYLNHIYFGCGIYGVEAAAQRFWGISACDISPAQAAALAGIVCCPRQYCPLIYPLSCSSRRNTILRIMANTYQWSDHMRDAALCEPLAIITDQATGSAAAHVREMLRAQLEKKLGKSALYTGGFLIYTTLNRSLQEQAEKLLADHCKRISATLVPDIDGALMCIERSTGYIKAWVGGADFATSKCNRVVSRRQIGSTIKPMVYAQAIMRGKNFADVEVDEPLSIVQNGTTWQPKNYDKKFHGKMTLAHALSRSNNIVAIKTMRAIGAAPVANALKACNFVGSIHHYPSLALGCIDATLQEVTGMFNVFANDGIFVPPCLITCIKNRDQQKILIKNAEKKRVLPSQVVGQVAYVLQYSLQRMYPLFPGKKLSTQVISKTGTTNDSRTCWYVGSTPDYTTGVYMGCDDNRSMGKHIFPVNTALPLWLDFQQLLPIKHTHFEYDPRLCKKTIHKQTGSVVDSACRDGIEILVL